MKSKRRPVGRRFHHFLRRVPHTVNSAARGSVLPRPVGVGVLDDPCLRLPPALRRRTSPVGDGVPDVPPSRSPPALPRSASPCRGGVPPPPGRRDDRRPRVAAPAPDYHIHMNDEHFEETNEIIFPTPEAVATLLDIDTNFPTVFQVKTTQLESTGQILEYSEAYKRGDFFKIKFVSRSGNH